MSYPCKYLTFIILQFKPYYCSTCHVLLQGFSYAVLLYITRRHIILALTGQDIVLLGAKADHLRHNMSRWHPGAQNITPQAVYLPGFYMVCW